MRRGSALISRIIITSRVGPHLTNNNNFNLLSRDANVPHRTLWFNEAITLRETITSVKYNTTLVIAYVPYSTPHFAQNAFRSCITSVLAKLRSKFLFIHPFITGCRHNFAQSFPFQFIHLQLGATIILSTVMPLTFSFHTMPLFQPDLAITSLKVTQLIHLFTHLDLLLLEGQVLIIRPLNL